MIKLKGPCLLLLLAAGWVGAARLSLGVAPAVVNGDVEPRLRVPLGEALAEMSSWELSLHPGLRVEAPDVVRQDLPVWTERQGVGASELEEGRQTLRNLSLDALLVPSVRRSGTQLELALVVLGQREGQPVDWRLEVREREDLALGTLRVRLLEGLDSLGVEITPAVRRMATRAAALRWDALVLYAKALLDLQENRKPAALQKLREVARLHPDLPALTVRLRTLERELQ